MKTRLGCLTLPAIATTLISLLIIGGITLARGGVLFSPGPLNAQAGDQPLGGVNSHAALTTKCAACHPAPWQAETMSDLCRACHVDVGQDPQNFHAALVADNVACRGCHTDHHGANAALTILDRRQFPHEQVGYSLKGHRWTSGGSAFACADCHGEKIRGFDQATCVNCHVQQDLAFVDQHTLAFGLDCLACHDGVDVYGKFNHAKMTFALTGKHATTDCAGCHAAARSPEALKSAPLDCNSCHAKDDSHQGQLGQDCAACHSPEDWKAVTYDHSQALFPLLGKHTTVACRDCHLDNLFKNTPQDCISCHAKDDVHKGEFDQDCSACHTPTDWKLTTFDHARSLFLLTGKHIQVECRACHTDNLFKTTPKDCFACHGKKDPHQGELGKACATCHVTDDWKQVTFDHSTVPFTLTGKHIAVECRSCHTDLLFTKTPQNCAACHAEDDKHNGELGANCTACHTTDGWKPSTFNHARSAYQLTGQHITANCSACHTNGKYKGTPQDCNACHAKDDKHNGQYGTDCATCHTTAGWAGVTFDHSRVAFKLTGKHVTVTCLACHQNGQFRGTPTHCNACHAKDDKHNGQFGTDCATCHTTAGWPGASFDHSKAAFQLTGKHVSVNCSSCHVNGQYKGTPKECYACHASDDKHNGQFGTDCAACHTPSGWPGASFDHSKTAFQLIGKHIGVNCSSCHVNGQYKGTPKECYACHASDDKHNGQFGTDCATCHTPSGWPGASFDHSKTAFQLTGKHIGVNCSACHVNGQYKGTPKECYACHAGDDQHNGQFGTNCAACHTTSGWPGASFNHSTTGFPLTGAHQGLGCSSCHPGGSYSGTPSFCAACHNEPAYHAGLFGGSCDSCHNTSSWVPASYTGPHTFPMNHGGNNSCSTCHPSTLSDYTCYSCHDQGEISQKHNEEGIPNYQDCMACHPDGRKHDRPSSSRFSFWLSLLAASR